MRTLPRRPHPIFAALFLLSVPFATGCSSTTSFVKSDTTLGRVVVYRNGVAYYERHAVVKGDTLRLTVPGDKVDDFLKSLTVVDAKTGKPAPVSYPTGTHGGTIDMKIELPSGGQGRDLKLTYVTEAPSWKPSYRLTVDKNNKVALQAWAIVDNTSGEDWDRVQLGVGASSALSFRFDLRSVRTVTRETLHSNDLFAVAPPTGGSSHGGLLPGAPTDATVKMLDFDDDKLRAGMGSEMRADLPQAESAQMAPAPVMPGGGGRAGVSKKLEKPKASTKSRTADAAPAQAPSPSMAPPPPPEAPTELMSLAEKLRASGQHLVIEGYAMSGDADEQAASLARANRARDLLVRFGVGHDQLSTVGAGLQPGKNGGVRFIDARQKQEEDKAKGLASTEAGEPIGTSHFESTIPMSVKRGTSAMVSILSSDTDGEVVYFFDPESQRGNQQFPFKAVRVKNPTDSALESGPVTVFGEGKFIGEGLTDAIPARATAFVPFALDRQILVETKEDESDRIARILTVQRGVLSTEMQHKRKQSLVFHNRTDEKAVVYIRRTVPKGYHLVAPASTERLGTAYLFRIEVPGSGKTELVIEEETPVTRSADLRTQAGVGLVAAYVSEAAVDAGLKDAVHGVEKLHKEVATVDEQMETLREQMGEYRTRMDELHAQIVTLKLVKTAGPLMQGLEKKLGEVSDKLSKSTLELVALQERRMVAKVKLEDAVAELTLVKTDEKAARAAN
jgi:hypothetical protein